MARDAPKIGTPQRERGGGPVPPSNVKENLNAYFGEPIFLKELFRAA